MTFGSKSVVLHLVRGCVGFGALATLALAPISPWWSIGLVPLALVALKGCPACWMMGLVETVAHRIKPRRTRTCPLLPE
jgi:hypothetical protein